MNNEFDEELERTNARRSRRQPESDEPSGRQSASERIPGQSRASAMHETGTSGRKPAGGMEPGTPVRRSSQSEDPGDTGSRQMGRSRSAGNTGYGKGEAAGSVGGYGNRAVGGSAGGAGSRAVGGSVGGGADGYGSRAVGGSAGGAGSRAVGGSAGGAGSRAAGGSAGGYGGRAAGGSAGGTGSRAAGGSTVGAGSRAASGSAGGYGSRGDSGSVGGYGNRGAGGSAGGYGNRAASGGSAGSRRAAAERAATVAGDGSTFSRNGAKAAKTKRRNRIILMIVAECLVLTCIFTYAFFAKRWNMFQRPDFEVNNVENKDLAIDTVEKMKGYWTIAVFGVDSRGNNVSKGTNADVNMICNINQDTGEIKLVSVFRDTYLNISDKNTYNKLNQAYALGGPEQAVKALNKNLDLNITDYVTFNWKAVADGINLLGGIDLEISKAEFEYINSFITETVEVTGIYSQHLKKPGMNHLDGVQAVAYGRLRLMDTDFARTERQRKVIELAFEKAKKADIAVLNQIMVVIFPQVATSIGVQDLSNVAFNVTKYHISETGGFPTARGDAKVKGKGACVIPQTLESNVMELHKFLFSEETYTPSNTVKSISQKIASESGMFEEGKPIKSVPIDGGYIPKESKEEKETKEETKESNALESTKATIEGGTLPKETGPNGEVIEPTEPETDANGNIIVRPTKPGTTTSPTKPGTTTESGTNPTKPGTTTSPTKPGTTTSPTKPNSTTSPSDQPGPGTSPTTPTTTPPTSSSGQGPGPSEGTADQNQPTVAPSPISPGEAGTSGAGPGGDSSGSGVITGIPGPPS